MSRATLIALARISSIMINNNSDSVYPYRVPDLRRKAFENFSPFHVILAVGLCHVVFIVWVFEDL